MKRWLHTRTFAGALGLAALVACSSSRDAGEGPAEPVAIQPQPIPEAGVVSSFVAGSFALKETAAGVEVSGRAESLGPSGLEPAAATAVSAFDATAGGAIVTATTTSAGVFTIALPAAARGHEVFVFFDGDAGGATSALLLPRGQGAPAVVPPCLTASGARGLDLGTLPALATRKAPLDLDNACDRDLAIAAVRVVGAPLVTAPPPPFSAARGRATRVPLEVRAPSKGPQLTFVVFDDGARRHVLALQAKGS